MLQAVQISILTFLPLLIPVCINGNSRVKRIELMLICCLWVTYSITIFMYVNSFTYTLNHHMLWVSFLTFSNLGQLYRAAFSFRSQALPMLTTKCVCYDKHNMLLSEDSCQAFKVIQGKARMPGGRKKPLDESHWTQMLHILNTRLLLWLL